VSEHTMCEMTADGFMINSLRLSCVGRLAP
jgi:hypothetical protein